MEKNRPRPPLLFSKKQAGGNGVKRRQELIEKAIHNSDGVNEILFHFDQQEKEDDGSKKLPRLEKPEEPVQQIPIKSVQDYSLSIKDQRDVVFQRSLEALNRLSDGQIPSLPPMRRVFTYIAKMTEGDQPPWFKSSQAAIINAQNLQYPRMDVLTRAYMMDFMRQASNAKGERPCGKVKCISERMSNGVIRCRELILPSSTDRPPHPEWCIMCQMHHTNKRYAQNRSKVDADSQELMLPIHTFIVQVDVEGEYRLDKTLLGDNECLGIYGPFPLFNVNFYAQTTFPNGTKGWVESDELVFRLSRAV